MSYEIIYDKQFIKVSEDKFVPMILTGSNNCYDYNNKRARSWWAYNINESVVLTLDEMIEYTKSVRQDIINRNNEREKDKWFEEYDDKSFGYWSSIAINGSTRNTTYGQFEGIFKIGCSKALTIEQLNLEHVTIIVKNTYYSDKTRREYGIEPFSKSVTSGQELIDAINECNELFKGTSIRATVEFGYMPEDKPKRLRKEYFSKTKKEKLRVDLDKYYTILVEGRYLSKHTSRGYMYSFYSPQLKYATKNEAKKIVNKFESKYPNREYEIKEINERVTLYI
jgi:hypothetical protein